MGAARRVRGSLPYRIVLHRLVPPLRALHLEHMYIAINVGHCFLCKLIVSLEKGVVDERMRVGL